MGNSAEKMLKLTEIIKNRCIEGRFKLTIIDGKEAFAAPLLEGLFVNVRLFRSKLKISFESGDLKELDMTTQVTILKYNRDTFTFVLAVTLSETFQIWNLSTNSIKSFLDWKEALLISKRPCWAFSPVCQICSAEFGTFTRTHHCRYCGCAVCDPCSRLEAKLEILGFIQPQRICSPCAKTVIDQNRSIINYRRSETQFNLKQSELVMDILGADYQDENQGSI